MRTKTDRVALERPAREPILEVLSGGIEIVDGIAERWAGLCAVAVNDEPFYRPEWIRSWVRNFAPKAKLHLLVCHSDAGLTAILPLVASRELFCGFPARVLRSPANSHSCRFDMLRAGGPDGDRAVAAVWQALTELRGWDVLHFVDVPEGGALLEMAARAAESGWPVGRWESMRTPVLPLPRNPGAQPWLGETTSGFRADLRRTAKRLAKLGGVELRHDGTADRLEEFYSLERSGWKGAAGTAVACSAATRAFYDEVAAWAAGAGWLSMHFLLSAGQPIAAAYGLSYGGRYVGLKTGFDENYKAYGPGHLLLESVIRDCAERGLREFDFTGPSVGYKTAWTRTAVPHCWLWIFRNSAYGRILYAARFPVRERLKRIRQWMRGQDGGANGCGASA